MFYFQLGSVLLEFYQRLVVYYNSFNLKRNRLRY